MSEAFDRALLLGTIATQLGIVTEKQLDSSLEALEKTDDTDFGTIIRDQANLDNDVWNSLSTLADKQIEAHKGSVSKSLNTLIGRSSNVSSGVWHTLIERHRSSLGQHDQVRYPKIDSRGESVDFRDSDGAVEVTRSGRFQKIRPHAEGGLGQVFVALDDELNRQVALKQIQDQLSGDLDARQRFMLEAEITGGLEHPGVVPVYGLGIHEDGQPYYAMRFIRGESMQSAIESLHSDEAGRSPSKTDRMFETRKLLSRVIDVCQAIGYAHSRGVLHRDIKPDNIMLGKFGETLVVDWGLARVSDAEEHATGEDTALRPASSVDAAATEMGSVVGTLAFMSPEQAAGDISKVDTRSDVFSLGATLYALLVGRPAMTSEGPDGKKRSISEILEAIQQGEFKSTREASPTTPKPLAAICDRAMSTDADSRYATAVELAEDIERWLADEPVSAYQETALERARRWLKRHQSLAASGGAVTFVSILGLASFSFVLNEKNTQLSNYADTLSEKNEQLDARGKQLEESNEALRIAERTARDEAATSLAVTEFLNEDLLSQASRRDHPNPKLEVRTVLDRAGESLEKEFADRPLVRANLLKTVGIAYGHLGEYQKSRAALKSSVGLFRENLGASHETTVARESELAAVLAKSGDYKRGEAMLRSSINRLIDIHGIKHKAVVDAQAELADLYTWLGDYESAERLIDQAIGGNTELVGPDHEDTLECLLGRANIWNYTFRSEEAIELVRDVITRAEQALGENHLVLVDAKMLLAQGLFFMEQTSDARVSYNEALATARRLLGDEHPSTLSIRHDIATLDAYVGNVSGALAELQLIRDLTSEIYGEGHRETIVSDWHLSDILVQLERLDEAQDLLKDAIHRSDESLGISNTESLALRVSLAELQIDLGEYEQAKKVLEELVALPSESLRKLDTVQSDARVLLAELYSETERVDDAIGLLLVAREGYAAAQGKRQTWDRRAVNDLLWLYVREDDLPEARALLEDLGSQPGEDAIFVASSKLSFASALIDAENYDEAEEYADEIGVWTKRRTRDSQDSLQIVTDLAAIFVQLERYDDALLQYRELIRKQTELLGADNIDTLHTIEDFAFVLDEAGQSEESIKVFKQLLTGQTRTYGPQSSQVAFTLGNLAQLYSEKGDFTAATDHMLRMRAIQVDLGSDEETIRLTDRLLADAYRMSAQKQGTDRTEAIAGFTSAIKYYESATRNVPSKGDPDHFLILHQLAWCYDKVDRTEDCIDTYRRVVRGRSRLLGQAHEYTLLSLSNMAYAMAEHAHDQTLSTLKDLENRITSAPKNAPGTGAASYQLGEAYRIYGNTDSEASTTSQSLFTKAIWWYERSADIRTANLGETHASTLLAKHQSAYTHSLSGDHASAVAIYRIVVPLREQTLGKSHEYTIQSLVNWGVNEAMLQNYDEAIRLLEDGVQRFVDSKGRDYPGAINPRITLAAACFLRKDYVRSIQMFRESLDVTYRMVRNPNPLVKREIAMLQTALANAELFAERFDDAMEHAKEGLETMEGIEADPLDFACGKSVLGAVAVQRGDLVGGEKLLLEANETLAQAHNHLNLRKRNRLQIENAERFIQLYDQQKDDPELAKWRKNLSELRAEKEKL